VCDKELSSKELILCSSCKIFVEWKYGSLKDFLEQHKDSNFSSPKPRGNDK